VAQGANWDGGNSQKTGLMLKQGWTCHSTSEAMQQFPTFGDERTLAACAFCGGETGTRDHCPSRVFLDQPYPENLPVVQACSPCNASFSEDEEYFACLVSCVIAGSTDPAAMPRAKTSRILASKPFLRARIEKARSIVGGVTIFNPEHERVRTVITKLAQGHALYELHESCACTPDRVEYVPLLHMSEAQRVAFENPEPYGIWPEVGAALYNVSSWGLILLLMVGSMSRLGVTAFMLRKAAALTCGSSFMSTSHATSVGRRGITPNPGPQAVDGLNDAMTPLGLL
jgi:hypothetical protein